MLLKDPKYQHTIFTTETEFEHPAIPKQSSYNGMSNPCPYWHPPQLAPPKQQRDMYWTPVVVMIVVLALPTIVNVLVLLSKQFMELIN